MQHQKCASGSLLMDIVCFSTAVSLLPIEFGPDPFLFKILSLHTELHNMNHLWMCLAARMHVLSFQDPSSNLWCIILSDLRVRKFFLFYFAFFTRYFLHRVYFIIKPLVHNSQRFAAGNIVLLTPAGDTTVANKGPDKSGMYQICLVLDHQRFWSYGG